MARKNQFPERKYTDTHASCSKCSGMKPFSDFHNCKTNPKGIAYWCKECANFLSRRNHQARQNDVEYKDAKRNIHIKHKFGLTLIEYTEKLKAQGCKCAICGVELPTSGHLTHLDHCHTTGKIRAFLCTNCNRGLGHFQDSVENLESAIAYLKTHNSNVD